LPATFCPTPRSISASPPDSSAANVTTNEAGIIEDEYTEIYAKDRADTFGSVFLGLTVGCATCHDHKFDPISQKDYYSLGAFFRNTPQKVMDGNTSISRRS